MSEIVSRSARRVRIRDVPFAGATVKKEFLFLFDFGDEWHFRLMVRRVSERAEHGAQYPRVEASHGEAPSQ